MDNYKLAAQLGLRFTTSKGSLSVEQLFHLTQTDLATSIKNQGKIIKRGDEDGLSFLDEATTVDKTEQLRFDILKDVYLTKKAEAEERRSALATKDHRQKILQLIEQKKDGELQNKTLEELEAMLAKA